MIQATKVRHGDMVQSGTAATRQQKLIARETLRDTSAVLLAFLGSTLASFRFPWCVFEAG